MRPRVRKDSDSRHRRAPGSTGRQDQFERTAAPLDRFTERVKELEWLRAVSSLAGMPGIAQAEEQRLIETVAESGHCSCAR